MIENANDKPQSLLKAESDLEREERILPTCDEKNIYKVEFDSINDALLNLEERAIFSSANLIDVANFLEIHVSYLYHTLTPYGNLPQMSLSSSSFFSSFVIYFLF